MINTRFSEIEVLKENGEYSKAISLLENLRQEASTPIDIAHIEYSLAKCYENMRDIKKAMDHYEKAAIIWKEEGDIDMLGKTQLEISLLYYKQKEYSNALIWVSKSEGTLKQSQNQILHGFALIKLGATLLHYDRVQHGRMYITKGLMLIRKQEGGWYEEMIGTLHMAEHRFEKELYVEMNYYVWASLGLLYESQELEKHKDILSYLYGLIAWGYLMSENKKDALHFWSKYKIARKSLRNDIQNELQEKLKEVAFEKKFNQ